MHDHRAVGHEWTFPKRDGWNGAKFFHTGTIKGFWFFFFVNDGWRFTVKRCTTVRNGIFRWTPCEGCLSEGFTLIVWFLDRMKDVNPFFVQSHCMGGGVGTRHKIACSSTQNRSQQNEKSFSVELFFILLRKIIRKKDYEKSSFTLLNIWMR